MTHPSASEIVQAVRDAGRRVTPKRELLFDVIANNPHLDAASIHHLAREANPRIGLATVYRTLKMLTELGLIDVSSLGEDHAHYELRGEDHVHLVCLRCGVVREIPPLPDIRALEEIDGFEIHQAHLELVGVCATCRKHDRADTESKKGNRGR